MSQTQDDWRQAVTQAAHSRWADVEKGNFDPVLAGWAEDCKFSFAGNNSLGAQFTGPKAGRLWYERLLKVMPNLKFSLQDVIVSGEPTDMILTIVWSLSDDSLGETFHNKGVNIAHFVNRKLVRHEFYHDTGALSAFLAKKKAAGIEEAAAAPITST